MMYEVVYGTSNEVGGDDGGGRWSARTVSFGDPCKLQGHSLPCLRRTGCPSHTSVGGPGRKPSAFLADMGDVDIPGH